MRSAGLATGAVVLAAGLGALAQLTSESAAAHVSAPTMQAPVGVTLVCPDVRYIPSSLGPTLFTFVGIATSDPGPGEVTLLPATGSGSTTGRPRVVLRSGQTSVVVTSPPTGPLVVQGSGPLVGGLIVEQLSRANKTVDRGWADLECSAPQADQWFVGPGTDVGQTPVLTLSNPDDTVAVVSVNILTPSGPAPAVAGQGITLAAHTVIRVPLASLAPGASATAVQVTTVRGRVAAALRDVRVGPGQPPYLGTDWVPPVDSPGSAITVAGIPGVILGQPPTRTLILANPGSSAATATVTATTNQGSYVPVGLNAVAVPADSVVTADVSGTLGTSPASLAISSGSATPLLASVLVDAASTTTPIHEIAYLGQSTPLTGTAVVPLDPDSASGSDVVSSILELSAPLGQAQVMISAAGGGKIHRARITIPAGKSISVPVPGLGRYGGPVTVTPVTGSGPVFGSRVIQERGALGPLISALPLVSATPLVAVPPVRVGPLF